MTSKRVNRQTVDFNREFEHFLQRATVDQLSRWLARQQVNCGELLAWCCYR
jgi:hypothetical protein